MYPKSEHTECVTRGFSASRQKYTTVFLSSFWFIFLLSFSKEGRKTNIEKEIIMFKLNISLKQIKIYLQLKVLRATHRNLLKNQPFNVT